MRTVTRLLSGVAVLSVAAAMLAGCSSGLNASSSCADYLKASTQDQQSAVDSLVAKLHADPSLTTPLGFPEIAYQCSSDPNQKLGAVISSVHD